MTFSMQAWMRGEIPSRPDLEKPEESPIRHVGVYLTKNGLQTFTCRTPERAPTGTIEVVQTIKSEVQKVEKQLLKKHSGQPGQPGQPFIRSYTGQVGDHYDGLKRHVVLCLGVSHQECNLLFFTSNALWSPASRPATPEECCYAGLIWNSRTYLAPAVRFLKEVAWTGRILAPHRVEQLRQEFFRAPV